MSTPKKDKMGLTAKDRTFADFYLTTAAYNATKAYELTYPKANKKTAVAGAYRILKKDCVMEYINKKREEDYKQLMLDAIRINEGLFAIAIDPKAANKDKVAAYKQLSKNLGLETANVKMQADIRQVVFEGEDDVAD